MFILQNKEEKRRKKRDLVCLKDFDNMCPELFGEGWNRTAAAEIKMMILKLL